MILKTGWQITEFTMAKTEGGYKSLVKTGVENFIILSKEPLDLKTLVEKEIVDLEYVGSSTVAPKGWKAILRSRRVQSLLGFCIGLLGLIVKLIDVILPNFHIPNLAWAGTVFLGVVILALAGCWEQKELPVFRLVE